MIRTRIVTAARRLLRGTAEGGGLPVGCLAWLPGNISQAELERRWADLKASFDAIRVVDPDRPANWHVVRPHLPADPSVSESIYTFGESLGGLHGAVREAALEVAADLAPWFLPTVQPAATTRLGPHVPYPVSDLLASVVDVTRPFNGCRIPRWRSKVVLWRYTAIHDRPLDFDGSPLIHATNRVITIDGVSIVRRRRGTETVTKFVDWNFVTAQLGLFVSNRPMLGGNANEDGDIGPI